MFTSWISCDRHVRMCSDWSITVKSLCLKFITPTLVVILKSLTWTKFTYTNIPLGLCFLRLKWWSLTNGYKVLWHDYILFLIWSSLIQLDPMISYDTQWLLGYSSTMILFAVSEIMILFLMSFYSLLYLFLLLHI